MAYRIITDTGADLPLQVYDELNVIAVPLIVNFRGESVTKYDDAFLKDFFEGLRSGENGTTSAVNPEGWANAIEPVLQAGEDVLVLTFTSGLSATYQSAVIAADELKEKYPERTINVVDTLCASRGQGLLVWYACQKRDEGMSLKELTAWCEDNKLNLCHWVTVNDLMHLKRGGRISTATAVAGTLLQVKPIIHVNDEGKLINVGKVRGRKGAIEHIANKVGELGIPGANDTVFICHGDCQEDAEYLASLVKEKFGVKNVVIYYVGAVIGAHTGPGVLAVFFLGEHR